MSSTVPSSNSSAGGSGSGGSGAAPVRVDPGTFVADALSKAGVLDGDTASEFGRLFSRFIKQTKRNALDWSKLSPPGKDLVLEHSSLEPCPDDSGLHNELLNKVAIVKLNGGLGTSMGCKGPKSAIPVRAGSTFLDLTVRQVEYLNTRFGVDVPLILMNSFRTHEATVKILNKYQGHHVSITCFTQSCFPRIDRDHFTPLPLGPFSPENEDQWTTAGHGEVYRALDKSGVLDVLLAQGRELVFISNVDNLGATVDLSILYHLISKDVDFCMEVTDKTRGDIQGGTLVEYTEVTTTAASGSNSGSSGGNSSAAGGSGSGSSPASTATTVVSKKPRLVELSQVPREHEQSFKSLKTFTCFNTNNLWANLRAIKELVASNSIQPPVVVNERTFKGGSHILELETAAGAAISFFSRAIGVRVPRSRFLPVKSTSDLLAIQSNLYDIKHGTLVQNPLRDMPHPPVIKLGPEFSSVENYMARLPFIPDLTFCDHLTVSGDVRFGRDVVLRGTVIIVANEGSKIDVPDGSVFENKIITGNLRILEH